MPLFPDVGKRIAERLLAMNYRQPNGKPDVRRFCLEHGYDKTLFYFWLRDANTPVKDRARLASDLGISEAELLLGVVPKERPGRARQHGKLRGLLLALGAAVALWPSGGSAQDLPSGWGLSLDTVHLIGSWRRWFWPCESFTFGMVRAS